jgi:hemerythrin superfamily protein
MIYEESSMNDDSNKVILNVYPMMKGDKKKVEKLATNANKSREEC